MAHAIYLCTVFFSYDADPWTALLTTCIFDAETVICVRVSLPALPAARDTYVQRLPEVEVA